MAEVNTANPGESCWQGKQIRLRAAEPGGSTYSYSESLWKNSRRGTESLAANNRKGARYFDVYRLLPTACDGLRYGFITCRPSHSQSVAASVPTAEIES